MFQPSISGVQARILERSAILVGLRGLLKHSCIFDPPELTVGNI